MLVYLVIIPIIIAVFLYVFPSSKIGRLIVIATQAFLVYLSVYLFIICKEGDIVTGIGNFDSVLGILLKADSLSSVFVALTTFVFLIATIYSFHENNSRLFWFLLFIWEGLLIGIFLSCDMFNIFVLIEVATIVVSILIMYNRGNRSMYDGMIYLMVNVVVVQFYLFGIGYVYKLTGVLDMDTALRTIRTLDKTSLILPYALIMTAVSLKCAFIPLFSWLPKAHGTPGAPSSVSAILSGLHIKFGVYLFIRFQAFFQDIATPDFFLAIGIITGIVGFIMALSQSDIKLILAYHTISQIGLITIGLNIPDTYAFTGGLYHVINHTLFKSALFLSAGMISNLYGTRDIYKIHGVFRRSPLIGIVTVIAVFGITGAPLFNGSISKYFIVSGTNWLVSGAIIIINLGTIISFIKYSSMLFGHCKNEYEHVKIDRWQQTAVLILGSLCFAGGIFGEQFVKLLFNINVSVDTAGYLQKTALFAVSGIAGYFIFKYYVKKSVLLKRLCVADFSFRSMCVCIGIFFAILIIVTKLFSMPMFQAFLSV